MVDLLKILPTWILLAINFCQCTLKPEISENSTDIATNTNTQYLISPHFYQIISGIYQQNFDNFDKVLTFAEISNDYIFKVDALLELYKAMSDVNHTKNPINAMYLYKEIETVINLNNESSNKEKFEKLQSIRQELLSETIVPKGSQFLENAVYTKEFIQEETKVGMFIELLQLNETLSSLTTKRMVQNLHWMPFAELLPILKNLSSSAQLNIDALLSLNDVYEIHKSEQIDLFLNLLSLEGFLSYKINSEKKRKMDVIIPKVLRVLVGGQVCFYHERTKRSYISCNKYVPATRRLRDTMIKFTVMIKEKPTAFYFKKGFTPVDTIGGSDQLKINFCQNDIDDIDWKVSFDGEQVLIQNMNNTMYLCAGEVVHYNVFTRTRESFLLHPDECKWLVESCSDY